MLCGIESASDLLAPQLFAIETANALGRYHRPGLLDGEAMRRRHIVALSLVSLWIPDTTLFPEALALVARLDHPVCDCLDVVTARRFNARLLTADQRLESYCQVWCMTAG